MSEIAHVPCGSCRYCCTKETVILHPEEGDQVERYQTRQGVFQGRTVFVLAHKADGTCVYLGPGGCTIHGEQPHNCKIFDCRRFAQRFDQIQPRGERRRVLKSFKGAMEQYKIGADMLRKYPL